MCNESEVYFFTTSPITIPYLDHLPRQEHTEDQPTFSGSAGCSGILIVGLESSALVLLLAGRVALLCRRFFNVPPPPLSTELSEVRGDSGVLFRINRVPARLDWFEEAVEPAAAAAFVLLCSFELARAWQVWR